MRRRAFLKAAAGLAVASACGPLPRVGRASAGPLPSALPPDEAPGFFPLGVQAGDVDQTSVRLWGFSPVSREVDLWVWDGEGQVLLQDRLPVDQNGHAGLILEDLEPGAEHFYAFCTPDTSARSAAGRFVTAFPDGALQPLTVACATCTSQRNAPFRALQQTARMDFDLTLHLGDMSYNDFATTPAEYRGAWRATLADPGYRALLPRAATYHAWDDHEFWNDVHSEADPDRMEIARDAFYESRPQRKGPGGRAWNSYRWGDTAEFFVLDARTERQPSTIGGDDLYLGREQMDWLKDGLSNSTARFKVLLNSVPMVAMPDIWPMAHDRWQGFARQRSELLEVLEDDDAARGTLILSGDFHVGFIGHVEPAGTHRRVKEIAVGPSGNANPLAGEWLRGLTFPGDRFDWTHDGISGTTLRFEPEAGEVTATFYEPATGEVRHEATLRPGEDD